MKNIIYTCKVSAWILLLSLPFMAQAQTPYTVVATGLKSPAGLEVDASNRLWLTQAGTGHDDGSVSILKADGTTLPVLTALPSLFDTAVQEISGAWHTLMLPNNQFALVTGEGHSPYSGSVLFFNLNGFTPGVSAAKTAAMNTRQIAVSTFMQSKGIEDSNPFSAALDGLNNVYVADAAANTVAKFNAANVGTIVKTLPDFAAFAPYTYSNTASDLFIDDIVYRRIPNVAQAQAATKTIETATISPNPANERLVISPDINTRDAWQIQLRNSFGQVVSTHTGVGSSPLEIAVSDYTSGVYIVEYQSETARWTKKVVVQH